MENKGVLTKILAIAGTVLVWFPILAPILLTTILFIQRQIFRLDYLMPAELGVFAFGGGIILFVAAIRAHSHAKLIGWGLGIALVMIVGGQALAVVTGLADGSTETGGWQWMLVLGSLVIYVLALIEVGVGGILLSRDVFKPQQLSTIVR
jgi:hypothetical protein